LLHANECLLTSGNGKHASFYKHADGNSKEARSSWIIVSAIAVKFLLQAQRGSDGRRHHIGNFLKGNKSYNLKTFPGPSSYETLF
jgi:hypothetical protein